MNLQEDIEEATSYSIRRGTDRVTTDFMDQVTYQGAIERTESTVDDTLTDFSVELDIDIPIGVL